MKENLKVEKRCIETNCIQYNKKVTTNFLQGKVWKAIKARKIRLPLFCICMQAWGAGYIFCIHDRGTSVEWDTNSLRIQSSEITKKCNEVTRSLEDPSELEPGIVYSVSNTVGVYHVCNLDVTLKPRPWTTQMPNNYSKLKLRNSLCFSVFILKTASNFEKKYKPIKIYLLVNGTYFRLIFKV